MKVAVIGSRNLTISAEALRMHLPLETTEIVSGGAKGVDTSAREYALANSIKLTEFLPEYDKYGRSAPLKRNITIIEYADMVLAFWDGITPPTNSCAALLVFLPQYFVAKNLAYRWYAAVFAPRLATKIRRNSTQESVGGVIKAEAQNSSLIYAEKETFRFMSIYFDDY